jgi:hypothetical protein
VIGNNVIHQTNIGTQYPCVFVYGGGPKSNIVEGNALWECCVGIQVISNAIVRNNVIGATEVGTLGAPHEQVPRIRRVSIVNNTVYGGRDCRALRWQGAREMVLANNALYCAGGRAVEARGLDAGIGSIRANLVEGRLAGAALDGSRFKAGGSVREAFRDPGSLDFWPLLAGPLIGVAAPELAAERDFNGALRVRPYDVGAYQSQGRTTNPGWEIAPGFKGR